MRTIWKLRPLPLLATFAVLALFAALAMCSRSEVVRRPMADLQAYNIAEPPPPPAEMSRAPDTVDQSTGMADIAAGKVRPPSMAVGDETAANADEAISPVEVTLPRLAFAYKLGFRLVGDRIAGAQDSHRRLCEAMGRYRCQLLALRRGAADDTETSATLKVRVATSEAQRFADRATDLVARAGGRTIATSVLADDVTKEMVDAEARIRQREMLVARLTEILRNRTGKVAELVEAERSVAAAQEELDQTRGWLTELRGRVAMSEIEISYAAVAPQVTPRKAGNQLGEALSDSGATFLIAIRSVLMLLIYLAPWMLLLVPLALLARRAAHRAAAGRNEVAAEPA